TPSTAGRPPAKTLTRSRTSSVAAMACLPQTLRHQPAGISCHCEPSGLAFGKPKDRLREAIPLHLHMTRGGDCFVGLRPPRNDKEIGLLTAGSCTLCSSPRPRRGAASRIGRSRATRP